MYGAWLAMPRAPGRGQAACLHPQGAPPPNVVSVDIDRLWRTSACSRWVGFYVEGGTRRDAHTRHPSGGVGWGGSARRVDPRDVTWTPTRGATWSRRGGTARGEVRRGRWRGAEETRGDPPPHPPHRPPPTPPTHPPPHPHPPQNGPTGQAVATARPHGRLSLTGAAPYRVTAALVSSCMG